MPDIVGIRFKRCGKIYHFEVGKTDSLRIKRGNTVIVESSFGLTIGSVVTDISSVESYDKELKKIMRLTTEEDFRIKVENDDLEQQAKEFCQERVVSRGLGMKLINTEVTLDRKRIVFYFTAEGRIDFRELVKDLASRFKTRIEMRQIGVRDETKFIGGLGICGREVCCRTFLSNFAPISIRMAKRQDLVLNPGKLSGLCGRLMCCLGFEVDDGSSHAEVVEITEDSPILEELDTEEEYVSFDRLAESIEAKHKQQMASTDSQRGVDSQIDKCGPCDSCNIEASSAGVSSDGTREDSEQRRGTKKRRRRSHKKPSAGAEGAQQDKKKADGETTTIIAADSSAQPSDQKSVDTPKEEGQAKKKWRPKRHKPKKKTDPAIVRSQERPGAVKNQERPGAVKNQERPGAVKNQEHPGAVKNQEHPGAVKNQEHPGAVKSQEHPGAVKSQERPGAVKSDPE
ncbi:MAG: stage 0 sporulation family protein [Nitrospirae bacterium]|nr:stage 0 sporulation family protein [Nitrospirota bacterium]MBF0591868.1 stage 0 sporulation family protein [Nitrospirota bacterium]